MKIISLFILILLVSACQTPESSASQSTHQKVTPIAGESWYDEANSVTYRTYQEGSQGFLVKEQGKTVIKKKALSEAIYTTTNDILKGIKNGLNNAGKTEVVQKEGYYHKKKYADRQTIIETNRVVLEALLE